ncbi:hypothetical protein HY024_00885 [Candidatus Curtissbacteria bacterium]|nr:hypothetical protein [Candidatus Curtissbacteria bacterium]
MQKQCQNYSPCKELCAKDPEKCKQLLQNYQKEGTKSAQPNIKPQNYQPSGYPKPYFNPQNGLPHPSSGAYPPQGVPASTPNSATYNGSTSGFYSPVPQPSAVPQVRGVKIVTSFFDRLFSLVFGN